MTPQRLRFERLYKPHTGMADAHLHLDFNHKWEVVSGRGRYELDGEAYELGPDESAGIQLGRAHRDLYNPFDEDALARFDLRPCNQFVETFFETLVWLFERGQLDEQERFPQLQLFVIPRATKARSYAAGPPFALQKAMLPLLAAFGRLRGYRPRYT